ncbi:MAG: MFS transporter [Canibacter sp.]
MTNRVAREVRNARWAVSAFFLTNGALFSSMLPRYPEIKSSLDLSAAVFGIAVAAFPAGAIIAGLTAAGLMRRFGSAAVAMVGTFVTAIGVLSAGLAPSVWVFASALFVAGASDAIIDVAQNGHGLRVQRLYGRSILNSFHAVWAVGAVTGGAIAAGAIALDLPLGIHLSISGVLFSAIGIVAYKFCLPGKDNGTEIATGAPIDPGAMPGERSGRAASGKTIAILLVLVLIAVAGVTVEDAGNTWAALYLSGSLGASHALAATGFISLMVAQFIGRLLGDRLVDRLGQRTVALMGGAIAAVGMGLALAFPSIPGTLLGFAAAGYGVATLVPAAMHAADILPGLRHGTGLTVVSWLMRLGFLFSPPIIGFVADQVSLRAGLLSIPIMGVTVLICARVLPGRIRPAH